MFLVRVRRFALRKSFKLIAPLTVLKHAWRFFGTLFASDGSKAPSSSKSQPSNSNKSSAIAGLFTNREKELRRQKELLITNHKFEKI